MSAAAAVSFSMGRGRVEHLEGVRSFVGRAVRFLIREIRAVVRAGAARMESH